jgi:hypothetical protein
MSRQAERKPQSRTFTSNISGWNDSEICSLLPMHIIPTGSRKARRSVFGNEEALIKVDIGTIESLLPSDIARGVNLRTLYTLMPSSLGENERGVIIERKSCAVE